MSGRRVARVSVLIVLALVLSAGRVAAQKIRSPGDKHEDKF
jgi:hypothetical protein